MIKIIFLSLIIVIALVLIDQAIKYFVMSNIDLYDTFYTLNIGGCDIFSITHVRNQGAAWSILEGKTALLVIIAAAAIFVVLFLIASGKFKLKSEIVMLSLIMAGGIGNLIDRIKYKEVIDYIRTDFINFPVFNFADICVVTGAIGFCILFLIGETIRERKIKESMVIGTLGGAQSYNDEIDEIDMITELSSDLNHTKSDNVKPEDSNNEEL